MVVNFIIILVKNNLRGDNIIIFRVQGKPKGKDRPRRAKYGGVYTPKPTKDYEKKVKESYIKEVEKDNFFTEGVSIKAKIIINYSVEASANKREKQKKLDNLIKPNKKPDIDNIVKILLDGLNGVAYDDDKQITSLECYKQYTEKEPYIEMWLDIDE